MDRGRLRRDRVTAHPGLDFADLAAGLQPDLGENDAAALVARPGVDHFQFRHGANAGRRAPGEVAATASRRRSRDAAVIDRLDPLLGIGNDEKVAKDDTRARTWCARYLHVSRVEKDDFPTHEVERDTRCHADLVLVSRMLGDFEALNNANRIERAEELAPHPHLIVLVGAEIGCVEPLAIEVVDAVERLFKSTHVLCSC